MADAGVVAGGNIIKSGDIWIRNRESSGRQSRVRRVQHLGILARNALYFCKVAAGAAVCDEQSDWHLLRERTGVNLAHFSAVVPQQHTVEEHGRKLYGVCFASDKHGHVHTDAHFALHDVWDSNFVFWCASAGEQSSWVQDMVSIIRDRHVMNVEYEN